MKCCHGLQDSEASIEGPFAGYGFKAVQVMASKLCVEEPKEKSFLQDVNDDYSYEDVFGHGGDL